MRVLYEQLGTDWAVFTMDHRGTGRSARLDCQPAQVETRTSERGTVLTNNELLAQCIPV